ncbi:hypothetical protein CEXT_210771, partial [Caerostris extrusa]
VNQLPQCHKPANRTACPQVHLNTNFTEVRRKRNDTMPAPLVLASTASLGSPSPGCWRLSCTGGTWCRSEDS